MENENAYEEKRRPGRPPMSGTAKAVKLTLRLTQDEADQISDAAEALHTTRTAGILQAVRRLMAD